MPNNWGGTRAGAGRKPDAVVEAQEANRDTVLRLAAAPSSLNPDHSLWEDVVHAMLMEALHGNVIAFGQLLPYIAGGKPTAPIEIHAEGQFNVFHFPDWWHPPTIDGTATELPQLTDGDSEAP